jgi:hypothetical protein
VKTKRSPLKAINAKRLAGKQGNTMADFMPGTAMERAAGKQVGKVGKKGRGGRVGGAKRPGGGSSSY